MIDVRPYRRLPLQQREELGYRLAEQYRRGLSMAALAAQAGTSVGRVRTLLLDQGARLRSPGGSRGRLRPGRSELAAALGQQYARGASLAELAARHQLSFSTVRRLVLAGGRQLRSRGARRRVASLPDDAGCQTR